MAFKVFPAANTFAAPEMSRRQVRANLVEAIAQGTPTRPAGSSPGTAADR